VPYANNQGVWIHYEVEGNGPPLVLLHGLLRYLEEWRELGYVDSLKKDFTLILMDMRGHGGSDKPHDPEAYKLKFLVADVIAVMDALNISKTHFLGDSLGGRMAFALAKYAPERFHSFIIGGQSPYARPRARIRWWLQLLKKGMGAFIEMFEKEAGIKMTPQTRAKILSNDTEALAAFLSASEWRASLEDACMHANFHQRYLNLHQYLSLQFEQFCSIVSKNLGKPIVRITKTTNILDRILLAISRKIATEQQSIWTE